MLLHLLILTQHRNVLIRTEKGKEREKLVDALDYCKTEFKEVFEFKDANARDLSKLTGS